MSEEELSPSEKNQLTHIRELWKVALETQMHFNDLLMKMRTMVVSIILALVSVATFFTKDMHEPIEICLKIHVISVALVIGIVILICQYIIDRFYYLKLLLGAVDYTKKIDDSYQEKYNGKYRFGLTNSILNRIDKKVAKRVLFLYYLIPIVILSMGIYIIERHLNTSIVSLK